MSNQTADLRPAAVLEPPTEGAESPLPVQLIGLPGGRWGLWRCVALRGAGFPARMVLRLSSQPCAEAADRLLRAEEEAESARRAALGEIERGLDLIRGRGEWETSGARQPLFKAMRLLNSRKLPKPPAGHGALDAAVESYGRALAAAGAATADFRRAYAEAAAHLSEEIREMAGGEKLREAIIWQNRHAFHNHVERANSRDLSGEAARGHKQRRDEELIASYVQRYCVKNDTIGFFGPVGWARLAPRGEALTALPGPALTESRSVYFESWGVKALADRVAADPEVLHWVAPRRVPYVRVEGNALHLPAARPTMLTPRQAAVLRACDGERAARELAAALRADARLGFKSDEDVYKVLEGLHARGLVIWDFALPLAVGSEKLLRRLFERIGPERLREPALAALAELEAARAAVARAAGDAGRLDRALGALEETFTRLTGQSPTRAHGQMYAARTLVYEDCRRDLDVQIGPDVLATLGPPLSLLLTSARWVSHKISEIYGGVLREVYEGLARKGGSPVVDAASFWARAQPLIFGEAQELPVRELEPLLQQRWARVLSLPEGARRVHYTSDALRPLVEEVFAAPRPGWMAARHHSPDLMIAAESVEAIRRGEYLLTIGELHLAANTLRAACFVSQHPAPEELVRAVEHDFPEPRPLTIKPSSWPMANVRTVPALDSPKDLHVAFAHDSVLPGGANVVSIADLVVEESGGDLVMRTHDGRIGFGALDAIGEGLSLLAVNAMKMLPPDRHNPRVTIDRLVVCRESWSFQRAELGFAEVNDDAARFLAARAWGGAHGMPRFVFVKIPTETKPFYLDFDSPLYIDLFSKVVRQMEGRPKSDLMITVTEMLPAPDQTWLPDAEGNRYTSELRMVAVDLDHLGGEAGGVNIQPAAD